MSHHFIIGLVLSVLLFAFVLVLNNETSNLKIKYEVSEAKARSFFKKMAFMAIDKKYEEIIATNLTEDYLKTLSPWYRRKFCEGARELNYLSVIKKINDFSDKEGICFPPLTRGNK